MTMPCIVVHARVHVAVVHRAGPGSVNAETHGHRCHVHELYEVALLDKDVHVRCACSGQPANDTAPPGTVLSGSSSAYGPFFCSSCLTGA